MKIKLALLLSVALAAGAEAQPFDSPPVQYGTVGGGTAGSATPSGPAGGDLTGTYPNPSVASIGGKAVSLGGALTTSGAFATTLTMTAATGVTLPTSGTLATLAGSEALTNKTYNGMTITANSGTLAIGNAKVFTASNTLTLTATDGSTLAIGAGGTLASAAYIATGTSGATIGLLNGANTYSGVQTFGVSGKATVCNGVTTACYGTYASSGADKAYLGYDIAGANIITGGAANSFALRNDNAGGLWISATNSGNRSIIFSGAYASCTALTTDASSIMGCTLSDRRLKNDEGKIGVLNALWYLAKMPSVHQFTFKESGPGGEHYGWFAQDIQAAGLPLVSRGKVTQSTPDGALQFDKAEIGPLAAEAIRGLIAWNLLLTLGLSFALRRRH